MANELIDKPTYEDYTNWYNRKFQSDLDDGAAEQWYETVTDAGIIRLNNSDFWQHIKSQLSSWNAAYSADHNGYPLLIEGEQPVSVGKKSFQSVLNKSFRWNILENNRFPNPPERSPSTAYSGDDYDPDDPDRWFGPSNWLVDFPDIFRTRLTTVYFDGVGYLAEQIMELANLTTSKPPEVHFRASLDGYHAGHLWVYNQLNTLSYENRESVSLQVRLEIQVTTTIQATISKMLHRIYEDWRLTGAPLNWEWDHRSPAFSVNYLGSTLHYLEGMIVAARDQKED